MLVESASTQLPFRPRARLLQLLGDQLIGSPRLAVFELVKNAYDADATVVDIQMLGLDSDAAEITVSDNGEGMSIDTITSIWLVPGHNHREIQRSQNVRTARNRLPLGEKGLGRFAVHKLGNRIELVTRRVAELEVALTIDWDQLVDSEFLEDAMVTIETREAKHFEGGRHGTFIRVSGLRGAEWTRGEVRRLARQITSISSPFRSRMDDFEARLAVPGHEEWLDDLLDVSDILRLAPWKFSFTIVDNEFRWDYEFRGVGGTKAEPRVKSGTSQGLVLDSAYLPDNDDSQMPIAKKQRRPDVLSSILMQRGIGPISGVFYVYDRDREVLAAMGTAIGLMEFLDSNGGVRVYRDGIRVYNYGEPTDDWLGLDLRRVNAPSKRISRNIVVAAVDLDLGASSGLSEKTNREGFVESKEYEHLRAFVMGAVAQLEIERNVDKDALRRLLRKAKSETDRDIAKPLSKIRQIAKSANLSDQIEPLADAAQKAYDDMREIMLRSGISNMTLAIVFHEIDHGVRILERSIKNGVSGADILPQARDLLKLLDGFGDLLKKSKAKEQDLTLLLDRSVALNRIRLRNHSIELEVERSDAVGVTASFPLGLALGAVSNVIDNSVYWLTSARPEVGAESDGSRAIYLGLDTTSFSEGPALVIADNGPGFADSLESITQPFFSRRPNGIGIGLYYVRMIMELSGGSLRLPERGSIKVPDKYSGAIVALVFKKV